MRIRICDNPIARPGVPEWRVAVSVGCAGALALGLLSALIRKEPTPRGDDLIYEDIARAPFGVHTYPFGFRLGLPLLVHILPFDHTTSFSALALVSAGGAAGFAFLLMRQVRARRWLAVVLAVLMCVSPPFVVVALRHGRNTDIATVFFMMAATYYAVRRQHWHLALTLLLGALVREAVLFIAPLAYALWAERPVDRHAALWALAVATPAIAVYGAVRLGVHTVGRAQVPGYGGSIIDERFTVMRIGLQSPFREARRLFTVYGPLWLVAPLAVRDLPLARRGLVLVALSLLAMTFATDWGRMILLASPVFYAASAHVLEQHRGWRLPVLAGFLALAVVYAVYMDHSGLRTGIIGNPPPPYPVR